MRRIVIGNWKMKTSHDEARALATAIREQLTSAGSHVEVGVTPPFTQISLASEILQGRLQVGAQDVHGDSSGACTGQVSVGMLKSVGATFSLVGHSEQRQAYKQSAAFFADRASGALAQGFDVVFCIGETIAERSADITVAVLTEQLLALSDRPRTDWKGRLVIAYEPVWAIGTGKTATPKDVGEAVGVIRHLLKGAEYPVLYGGSVTPANAAELIVVPGVNGFLVGGASLKPQDFIAIVRAAT